MQSKHLKALRDTIFLENPDGTITEAVPLKAHATPSYGAQGDQRDLEQPNSESDTTGSVRGQAHANASLYRDIEFMYRWHGIVFIILLCVQFAMEALYIWVFLVSIDSSVSEFVAMYGIPHRSIGNAVFWAVLTAEISYDLVYFSVAALATFDKSPKHYHTLASTLLVGLMILLVFAYVDKFNFPMFFLRILAYIYARYLQGLASGLMLLAPPRDS